MNCLCLGSYHLMADQLRRNCWNQGPKLSWQLVCRHCLRMRQGYLNLVKISQDRSQRSPESTQKQIWAVVIYRFDPEWNAVAICCSWLTQSGKSKRSCFRVKVIQNYIKWSCERSIIFIKQILKILLHQHIERFGVSKAGCTILKDNQLLGLLIAPVTVQEPLCLAVWNWFIRAVSTKLEFRIQNFLQEFKPSEAVLWSRRSCHCGNSNGIGLWTKSTQIILIIFCNPAFEHDGMPSTVRGD